MPPDPVLRLDWRDGNPYAWLVAAEPAAFAWEWLRRDPGYRRAAAVMSRPESGAGPPVLAADKAAARWGLHAFEHPDLPAPAARPVWRSGWHPRVLAAGAQDEGPAGDRFDLGRFAALATVVKGSGADEHVLISDGASSLRIDVESGTLLAGPVRLAYRLAGLAGLEAPLDALRRLLRLWRTGRLDPPPVRGRNRRLILLLRAHDALREGATQREIASVLLSREPAPPRWRAEVPSLRSRAQRLVQGARAMAAEGYRALLKM